MQVRSLFAHRILSWLLALALGLSACGGQTSQLPAATATPRQPGLLVTANPDTGPTVRAPDEPTVLPAPAGCRTYRGEQAAVVDNSGPLLPGDWILGAQTPTVTLVVYGDFQCAACAQLAPVLSELAAEFPDDVRIVYRHFPLLGTPEIKMNDKSGLAVQAAEAAARQDKFWEMFNLLYNRQAEWVGLDPAAFQPWLEAEAPGLGLDPAKFSADLTSPELADLADKAWQNGLTLNLPEPPVVFLNGKYYDLPVSYRWNLAAVIRLTLLGKEQFATCPQMSIDPFKRYTATLKTEKGDIVIELFADQAPLAVNNFVFLARQGWYRNLTFHSVLPGYFAQSGDPSGTGFGGPGYAFDTEIVPGLKFDRAGRLAMANAGYTSNGSQFFITYAPDYTLNGRHTIFGQVTAGMDVLAQLTPRNPNENADLPPGDKILEITIDER